MSKRADAPLSLLIMLSREGKPGQGRSDAGLMRANPFTTIASIYLPETLVGRFIAITQAGLTRLSRASHFGC
jgi:hypothetical protein